MIRVKVQVEIDCYTCSTSATVDAYLDLEEEIDRIPMTGASIDIQWPAGWETSTYTWSRRICPACVITRDSTKHPRMTRKKKT